jgi:membrane protein DedA with SNARE-associated domain
MAKMTVRFILALKNSPARHASQRMLLAVEMSSLVSYGYLGIILYMILTGCGLPMPEEVAIIAGAALAASGQLNPWLTLGSLLIGALLGDCVMYFIGKHFGRRLLNKNRIWNRLITPERERNVESLLAKHGVKVLLGARFLVGLRGPMYITAGILKVPFKRFVLADLFCASIVVTLFFGLTYAYGAQIMRAIHEGEGWLTTIVIAAGIVAAGVGLWFFLRRQKKAGLQSSPADGPIEPASVPPAVGDSQITGFLRPNAAIAENGQPASAQAEKEPQTTEPPAKP